MTTETPTETTPSDNTERPSGPRYVFIGFNGSVDRQSVAKLLNVIGAIMERRPRPQALVLCLSSEGGAMDAAFYGFEILRSLPLTVATHNLGIIASAANILFMGGSIRFASPNTSFLFHQTKFTISNPGIMSQDELRFTAANIRTSDTRTADIIADRIGKPAKEVRKWFGEKMRTAEFALQHGIIGGIQPVSIGNEDDFVQVIL